MLNAIWQSLLLTFSLFHVGAVAETDQSPYPGDSVDDIAVWVNPTDPSRSLIMATVKGSSEKKPIPLGILVYDLDGNQTQFLKGGSPNNIDIRQVFNYNGDQIPVIAVSHWKENTVSLHTIDPIKLELVQLSEENIDTGLKKTSGICLYQSDNQLYYFVIDKHGEVRQFMIQADEGWSATQVRRFDLNSRAEGCVVDDYYSKLYISEEKAGIWKYDADPTGDLVEKFINLTWYGAMKEDLEGLTIYDSGDGRGYLIVSSQGNSKYCIFNRISGKHVGSFRIQGVGEVDGTTQTDGIEAVSFNFGPRYPAGMFIAQDDANVSPGGIPRHQNVKIVDWREIQQQLDQMATR